MNDGMIIQRSCRTKFSKIINTIIEGCENIENPSTEETVKELDENYSKLTCIYNQLNEKHFNPKINQTHFIDQEQKNNLNIYLNSKDTELHSLQKFTEILRCSPTSKKKTSKNNSHFTFDNAKALDLSQILLKNKRGFGKVWNHKSNISLSPKEYIKNLTETTPINEIKRINHNSTVMNNIQLPLISPLNRSAHYSYKSTKSIKESRVKNRHSSIIYQPISPKNKKTPSNLDLSPQQITSKEHHTLKSLIYPIKANKFDNASLPLQLSPKLFHNSKTNLNKIINTSLSDPKNISSSDISEKRKGHNLGEFIHKLLEKNLGIKNKL